MRIDWINATNRTNRFLDDASARWLESERSRPEPRTELCSDSVAALTRLPSASAPSWALLIQAIAFVIRCLQHEHFSICFASGWNSQFSGRSLRLPTCERV